MTMQTSETCNTSKLLTSFEVGDLLQMNPATINRWVKEGKIRAHRTPGRHSRISTDDLIAFMIKHSMPIPPALQSVGPRRLLVVDDDHRLLIGLERLLKPYARQVQARLLDRGIDALVQVGAFKPHMVLLDLVMPDLDGIEVCRRLKAMEDTREVVIVVTSGHLTPEREADALAAGALRCLPKPVDLPTLLDLLKIMNETSVQPAAP